MNVKQDIYLDVGASWGVTFKCSVSLTGAQVTFWLGDLTGKTLIASVGNGITLDPDDETQCFLDLSPQAQAALQIPNADAKKKYELWVVEADGAESRQAFGSAYLSVGLAKKFP